MSNLRKKKKWIPHINSFGGIYSTRAQLPSSYQRSQSPYIITDSVLPTADLGGSDEDPLPKLRSSLYLGHKYNGTLFRSTTARPLYYEPLLPSENHHLVDYSHQEDDLMGSPVVIKTRRVIGLIKRYLLIKIRDFHRIANLLYFPAIDILIGGLIWMWREQHNPDLSHACTEYLLALIFWIIANSTQFEACFNFLEEFQSRNLINLFASTLEHGQWITASAFLSVIEACMSTVICSLIAYFGFGLKLTMLGWSLPCAVGIMIASGWSMGIFTCGLFLLWGQKITFLIWAIPYLILPLSAPFYPVSVLPVWAQYIAYCLPPTYIFEELRNVAVGQTMALAPFLISFILSCGYVVLAIFFFNYMFKKSKEVGLARLEQE